MPTNKTRLHRNLTNAATSPITHAIARCLLDCALTALATHRNNPHRTAQQRDKPTHHPNP